MSSISLISSMRRRIQKFRKLDPNVLNILNILVILNILNGVEDPKLRSWFPISSISSKRMMIPNWKVGSQYRQYLQYPQRGGWSQIGKLVFNIINILIILNILIIFNIINEEEDPKLGSWSQYHQYPQYYQRGGRSQIWKLVPNIINILNILKEEDDLKLGSWFPISVFDWDSDAPVDIRPTVTDNHERDDHR